MLVHKNNLQNVPIQRGPHLILVCLFCFILFFNWWGSFICVGTSPAKESTCRKLEPDHKSSAYQQLKSRVLHFSWKCERKPSLLAWHSPQQRFPFQFVSKPVDYPRDGSLTLCLVSVLFVRAAWFVRSQRLGTFLLVAQHNLWLLSMWSAGTTFGHMAGQRVGQKPQHLAD